MKRRIVAGLIAAIAVGLAAQAQPPGRRADSPAAAPIPATVREQSYSPELVEAGATLFGSQCGFCHGLDAAGGSGGPDLTRSELVAGDFRGDAIIPVVRDGRLNADIPMPAFPALPDGDLEAMVAYIHEQKTLAASLEGGRRAVSAEDIQSGDPVAGRRYFDANCAECHSADGDLNGIAARIDGLDLLRRMLNPDSGRGNSVRATPRVTVTAAGGEQVTGLLEYRDEFVIALIDGDDRYRSFSTAIVTFEIEDPLARHIELLGEYTNEDMHDVVTYLHTLR
jgi:cytochrome c oxidase cbb3-type subunit 3